MRFTPEGGALSWPLWAVSPTWAGEQPSSTMDYLIGIVLLLCGLTLPERVAPQQAKRNVPRLRLSYNGKFAIRCSLLGGLCCQLELTACSVPASFWLLIHPCA